MATAYRLAAMASARSVASRPNSVLRRTMAAPKPIPTFPFSSSTSPLPRAASRVVAAMGSVESMMPLHSAIASARLRSSIAFDSSCWSFLSQDFAVPR
ncbi:uncharacterized protein LOC113761568 isoform X2 [Coffea eugenioides]|uniref:Uncharacterized protein isoform X2 n=1 Tax=Coffea arabica TaxID=13443 RepID=A0ABM4WG34_COFAR|nr:uncharacterized protein LOC113761568 isoform X2 [Coffea eugenioides]